MCFSLVIAKNTKDFVVGWEMSFRTGQSIGIVQFQVALDLMGLFRRGDIAITEGLGGFHDVFSFKENEEREFWDYNSRPIIN